MTSESSPDRRRFLTTMGRWSLGVLLSGVADAARAASGPFRAPPYPRPVVPGACIEPITPVEKTLAAVLDAVVPGAETDPEGTPGALEACAMNLMVDDTYPFKAYGSLFATLMDTLAESMHGGTFVSLSNEQRLSVLVGAEDDLPLLRLAYRAIRSAFYGGAYNGVGLTYVAYPGPNLGYRHIAEASFRKPVCKERTDEGWMP